MKKLSNQELNQRMYSRAADRATNELEENTVWAMAEVNSSADEAIEIADDLVDTIKKIAYVSSNVTVPEVVLAICYLPNITF